MTLNDSMDKVAKTGVNASAGLSATGVLAFIARTLEYFGLGAEIRELIVMGLTMILFSTWSTMARWARRKFGARERRGDWQ